MGNMIVIAVEVVFIGFAFGFLCFLAFGLVKILRVIFSNDNYSG
jgi:hypothetical protein